MSFLDGLAPLPTIPHGFTHAARPGPLMACGAAWPLPEPQTAPVFSVFRQNVTCPACIKVLDDLHVFAPDDPWLNTHNLTPTKQGAHS